MVFFTLFPWNISKVFKLQIITVPIYILGENITRICNGVDNHCVYLAEMDMLNASIDGHLLKLEGKQTSTECDCLPICSKMNYIIQSSQLNWNWAAEDSNYTKGYLDLFLLIGFVYNA
uniref:Uncharacterized protein LOC114348761 n=1 Tax=Diabrotica virgifera virgifera TaxID=50390 RepID=A0A6P7GZ91_DIAVI